MASGDRNTSYFHAMRRSHRFQHYIPHLNTEEGLIEDPQEIQNHLIQHLEQLFREEEHTPQYSMLDNIPPLIEESQHRSLRPTREPKKGGRWSKD